MVGIDARLESEVTLISGSGKFNTGITGADSDIFGGSPLLRGVGKALLRLCRLTRRSLPEVFRVGSTSFGFQSRSKLTMGRPGRSLTAVGIGSLGLRSLRFILVAARISSLRTSLPFFIRAMSEPFRSLSLALAESGGVGGKTFDV